MKSIIDPDDFAIVQGYTWTGVKKGRVWYARAHGDHGLGIYLHRLVTGAVGGDIVDHINHDGLDNRRCNLSVGSATENQRNRGVIPSHNTSGYMGVVYRKDCKKWRGSVNEGGCRRWTSLFDTAEDAARARDALAREVYGDRAYFNFPEEV